ncbi:hypothetical protein [Amycolatopsis thermoflava]|uniref:hypothetical protein n=1 Tax=Amycolatopsis thermoflava TaxID=84480 RepID=UPI003EB83E7F
MGQTAPGSYIVTAYAPAEALIPLSGKNEDTLNLPGVNAVTSRNVTLSVSESLEAAAEAVAHFNTTGSLSAFESGVEEGLSYELAVALGGVVSNSDGGDITIDWDPLDPVSGSTTRSTFEFRGSDAQAFELGARLLSTYEEGTEPQVLIGRVHLLTKRQAGAPGVFGLETVGLRPARRYRIRLVDPEQYHEAVRAHDEDLAIRVSGNVEQEGSIRWAYNAQIESIVGPISELEESAVASERSRTDVDEDPNQIGFNFKFDS